MLYVGKNRLMNINVMSDEDSKAIEEEIAAIKLDIDAVKEDVASADSKAAEKTRTIVFDTFLSLYSFIDNNSPTTIDGAEFYANQMRTGDIIRVIEDGVSDFWYEEGAGEEESGIYEYNDTEYSLAVRGEYHDSVLGIIHETAGGADTGELERYVQSAAESAQEAAESAQEAAELAQKTNTELSDYVKKTDYASATEAGVVKIDNAKPYGLYIDPTTGLVAILGAAEARISAKESAMLPITPKYLDYAVKVGLTTNTQTLTDEEKAAVRKWIEAIGPTDYASEKQGGIVKASLRAGTRMMSGGDYDGVLDVCAANKSLIDGRTPRENPLYSLGESNRHTIVPSNLDYAVKAVLSDCKIAWTDEEKTAAKELLGIKDPAGFVTMRSDENGKLIIPKGVYPNAQLLEIHGWHEEYAVYKTYMNCVPNYPVDIFTDSGRLVFMITDTDAVDSNLPDFGIQGNYIFFSDGRSYYKQTTRLAEYSDPGAEGEYWVDTISDTHHVYRLAEPIVKDVTDIISTGTNITNIKGAEYLIVTPRYTEDEVKNMVNVDSGSDPDNYSYAMPYFKIVFENQGG